MPKRQSPCKLAPQKYILRPYSVILSLFSRGCFPICLWKCKTASEQSPSQKLIQKGLFARSPTGHSENDVTNKNLSMSPGQENLPIYSDSFSELCTNWVEKGEYSFTKFSYHLPPKNNFFLIFFRYNMMAQPESTVGG